MFDPLRGSANHLSPSCWRHERIGNLKKRRRENRTKAQSAVILLAQKRGQTNAKAR
jgi:hypothetical protein